MGHRNTVDQALADGEVDCTSVLPQQPRAQPVVHIGAHHEPHLGAVLSAAVPVADATRSTGVEAQLARCRRSSSTRPGWINRFKFAVLAEHSQDLSKAPWSSYEWRLGAFEGLNRIVRLGLSIITRLDLMRLLKFRLAAGYW